MMLLPQEVFSVPLTQLIGQYQAIVQICQNLLDIIACLFV